jgi:glucokinase
MTMAASAGFDMGGTQLKYGLLDGQGAILYKNRIATPPSIGDFLESLSAAWADLKKRAGGPIAAAGFGFPGIYDLDQNRIRQSPHCSGLDDFDLAPALAGILNTPFVVDNDANMAAYGEWARGAGRGTSNLVVMTIGTGVGAGIVVDGKIWAGRRGYAGEIGHVSIRPDGPACPCGNRGCLETEVSARAVVRRYRESTGTSEPLTPEEIHRRAEDGDAAARRAFDEAGTSLGLGLGMLINLLNPEMILLGGGIMTAGDLILKPAIEEAGRRSYRAAFDACTIGRTTLGNDAGWIGAAARAAGCS